MKKYIIISTLLLTSCASNKPTQDDKNLYDLLHTVENIAYKSITIEDYKEWENDEC